jgi:hypothetical protein
MRRRLKAAIPLARTANATVHDRRATELPKGAIVAPVEVEDPYARGERISALTSLRDDPLGALWARHQIDDARFMAGRHWQKIYETAAIGDMRSIDLSAERIDGGTHATEPLNDRRVSAMAKLRSCRESLGTVGESLVTDVLGRSLTLVEVAASRGLNSHRHLDFLGQRFRECLETLAVEFGYA